MQSEDEYITSVSEMEKVAEGLSLCEGVSLLLQRMKSHPNEFDVEHGKWSHVLQGVYERIHRNSTNSVIPEPWMSRTEVEAIWRTYVQLKQKRFHSWVMETLLTGEAEEDKHFSVGAVRVSPAHNNINTILPPGSWQTVATQISNTPLTSLSQKLKDKLNNI